VFRWLRGFVLKREEPEADPPRISGEASSGSDHKQARRISAIIIAYFRGGSSKHDRDYRTATWETTSLPSASFKMRSACEK
jgi:hypothetical protein